MPFVAVLSGCNKDPVVPLAAADSAEAATAAARARFGNLNEWISNEYALDSDGESSSGSGAGEKRYAAAFGTEPYQAFLYVPPEANVVATYEPTEATREQLSSLGLAHVGCGRYAALVTIFEVAPSAASSAVDLAWIARLNLG